MIALSVLFVTTRFPLPLLSGDRARAFHQLRLLARRHRVTLVTFADPAQADARAALEALGVRVVTAPLNRSAAAWRIARAVWSELPLQAALFASARLRREIRAIVAADHFDVAHVQLARAMPLVGADLGLPRVVDLVDALSLNMQRRAEHERGPLKWAAAIDAVRLSRYERAICRDVEAATVVAPADRDAIGAMATLTVNPNGVDLASFPWSGAPRDRTRLVFTGNLGYYANVEAIGWFVEHVLPRIWRDEPGTRLDIVGAHPHARVRALAARDARIEVTGYVERLQPWLAKSRVAVAPMHAGSGQLLKVLEAMAVGAPVVATPRALSGIEARHGEHALVSSTPADFAAQVVSIMRDDRLAHRLSTHARALVERLYTWERSVDELERIYVAVVPRARTTGTCA